MKKHNADQANGRLLSKNPDIRFALADEIKRDYVDYHDDVLKNKKIDEAAKRIILGDRTVKLTITNDDAYDDFAYENPREFLENILKKTIGDKNLYFDIRGSYIVARLTGTGISHLRSFYTEERASIFNNVFDVIEKAEYIFSSMNGKNKNADVTQFDYFLAVCEFDNGKEKTYINTVFNVRELTSDERHQLYDVVTKKGAAPTHQADSQEKTPLGITMDPLRNDNLSHPYEVVNESERGFLRKSINAESLTDYQRSELDQNADYALNINIDTQDFVSQILSGEKTIETRARRIPGVNIGDRVGIVATGNKGRRNQYGKSLLRGYATVTDIVDYENAEQFRADEDKHLVKEESAFDIQDGKTKVGYVLSDVVELDAPVPTEPDRPGPAPGRSVRLNIDDSQLSPEVKQHQESVKASADQERIIILKHEIADFSFCGFCLLRLNSVSTDSK